MTVPNDPRSLFHPRLCIDADLFGTVMVELGRRGGAIRETGAFLLTETVASSTSSSPDAESGVDRVDAVAYYDDLDPDCLTGGITFGAVGYSALGDLCRRDHVRVVGDVHTHPSSWVNQSNTDAEHPMVALPGHVALIVPHYAQYAVEPDDLGVHIFAGGGRWDSFFGANAAALVRLIEPIAPVRRSATTRSLIWRIGRWFHRLLMPRRTYDRPDRP